MSKVKKPKTITSFKCCKGSYPLHALDCKVKNPRLCVGGCGMQGSCACGTGFEKPKYHSPIVEMTDRMEKVYEGVGKPKKSGHRHRYDQMLKTPAGWGYDMACKCGKARP